LFGPCEFIPSEAREALFYLNVMWHLYIIQKNGRYYTGITTNLPNRLRQHANPELLYEEVFPNKFQAAKREKQIKGFSRYKKEKLWQNSAGQFPEK